jgi:hypothetical protein
MALYKFTERQVGFKFNQPTKAFAAHGHISPINMLSGQMIPQRYSAWEFCAKVKNYATGKGADYTYSNPNP